MFNLSVIYINVDTTQQIYCLGQCSEVYADIVLNIQVQVRVQHTDCLCRTA